MEDLRDEKTKSKEEGKKLNNTERWVIIQAVVVKLFKVINNFITRVKNKELIFQYYLFWIIVIILIASFPAEIGGFIGNWINVFNESFNK